MNYLWEDGSEMKKKIIGFFFSAVMFISCKSDYSKELEKLEAVKISSKEIPFIFSPYFQNIPLIKMNINERDYILAVDTGAMDNLLIPNFNTTVIDEFNFYENIRETEYSEFMDNIEYKINFYELPERNSTCTKERSENSLDGILGMQFLRNHKNVVFDYKRQMIYFDTENISAICTPLYCLISGEGMHVGIFFECNGKTEFGLIDTGCSGLTVRENFLVDDNTATFESVYDAWMGILNTIRYANEKYVVEHLDDKNPSKLNIKIADVKLKNIWSLPFNSKFINTNERCSISTRYLNLIGSMTWLNHIIQLDFEEMEFRIK